MPITLDPRTADMSTRAFGVSLETVGVTRAVLAAAVAKALPGATVTKGADALKSYFVTQADGRRWRLSGEASGVTARGWSDRSGTLVSPVLSAGDMRALQEVVRAVRACGAEVDASCSVKVNVDARDLTAAAVGRLVTGVSNADEMLDRSLGIAPVRRAQTCKVLPVQVRDAIIAAALAAPARALGADVLAPVWYAANGATDGRATSQHPTSAYGLNLHSLFYRGTIEFRHFGGSMHAGEVTAYVLLALAFVARAVTVARVNLGGGLAAERDNVSKALGHFFYDHALGGDALAEVRKHLTRRITGATPAPDTAAEVSRRPRARRTDRAQTA